MTSLFLAAAESSSSSSFLGPFRFDWPYFVSCLISFLIVLTVLRIFAFKPVLEMLEQRKARIAEGEEKLKRIEQQLAESEEHTKELIGKANEDAARLIEEAKQSATVLSEKKAQEAVVSAQKIIAKAEEAAAAERKAIESEIKQQFGRLVTTTTANVTGKVLNDDDQKRINEEALRTVEA